MNITNTVNRDGQNYIVLNSEGGQIAMNLGCALAAADGDDTQARNVIRTTKYLAEIQTRRIDEDEANSALETVVNALNEKAGALVQEFNGSASAARMQEIETEIVSALS